MALCLDEVDALHYSLPGQTSYVSCRKRIPAAWERPDGRANVRIIAATDPELLAAVRDGSLQEKTCSSALTRRADEAVPALRERPNDIPLLLEAYGARYAEAYNLPTILSDTALKRLTSYAWPGNIRELGDCLRLSRACSSTALLHRAGDFAAAGRRRDDTHQRTSKWCWPRLWQRARDRR